MALESGMNENPGQVSSLQSRLICDHCGCEPQIVHPEKIKNDPFLTIMVKCHGQSETKVVEKSKLVFTQHFFTSPE